MRIQHRDFGLNTLPESFMDPEFLHFFAILITDVMEQQKGRSTREDRRSVDNMMAGLTNNVMNSHLTLPPSSAATLHQRTPTCPCTLMND